ncbi:MAG: TonB-dependent receptor [Blastocatellia bacterium]
MKRAIIQTIILTLASLIASGQSTTGSISGVVVDSGGSVIGGARVVILQANRIAIQETSTNSRGEFIVRDILTGDYTVSVEKDGLTQPGGAHPVRVEAGRTIRGSIVLTVAAIEDGLIISATRTDSRLTETPSRVHLATESDITRAQRISVADVLRTSPGVQAFQTGRRGGVTSMFLRGGESDYTKVLIDGVPSNDAGGSFDLADLTVDNLARIELVRGAQSAIYGSDAMSGVLQIFTHRGNATDPQLDLSLEGGSFALTRQFARLSGLANDFDYSTSFTHLRTNGRDRNDDYQNRIATANFGYRLNVRSQARLTLRNENSGAGVPGPTARLFVDPDERIERRRVAMSGRVDDQTTNFWHQSFTYAYSANHQLSFDPAAQDLSRPGTPPDGGTAFNDFRSLFSNHQRRFGFRYQSDLVAINGHFISSGIDYETESAVFDSGFEGLNRVTARRNNTGIYTQDQFSYGSRLFFNAGVRVESNQASLPTELTAILKSLGSASYTGTIGFGTRVMPKAALTWVVQQSGLQSRFGPTRLRANYGEGLKAPTLIEAFSPNQYFLGNPGLRPERARSFDLGLEQLIWRDRYRIEVNYFDNHFRDQIAFNANPVTFGGPVPLPDGRLTHYLNNDRARARGYEAVFSGRPIRRLQVSGHYTFLTTRLVAAAPVINYATMTLAPNPDVSLELLRRPRHSGAVNVSWLGNRFDLNLDALLVGQRRDIDPVSFARFNAAGRPLYNPSFSRVDLAGSVRLTAGMSLFARVENMLNRDYQEVLGYRAYGMTFSSGLRISLGRGR